MFLNTVYQSLYEISDDYVALTAAVCIAFGCTDDLPRTKDVIFVQ
jgi:hypothetical protein